MIYRMDLEDISITSDQRLKYRIENMENGLAIIRELQPKKYLKTKMNATEEEIDQDGKFQIGLIAQDVLNVKNVKGLHKLVTGGTHTDDNGEMQSKPFAVKYNDIHMITLLAVKELDALVTHLTQKVDVLTRRCILLEKNKTEKRLFK